MPSFGTAESGVPSFCREHCPEVRCKAVRGAQISETLFQEGYFDIRGTFCRQLGMLDEAGLSALVTRSLSRV
eukprot:765973-Hanusia_phi.AAC.4